MKAEFVNLTPHDIKVVDLERKEVVFEKSGIVARVEEEPGRLSIVVDEIPLYSKPKSGNVIGIPEPKKGVYYIVSGKVLESTDRTDVVAPATGPQDNAIRNEKGHIVAVTRFILNW